MASFALCDEAGSDVIDDNDIVVVWLDEFVIVVGLNWLDHVLTLASRPDNNSDVKVEELPVTVDSMALGAVA